MYDRLKKTSVVHGGSRRWCSLDVMPIVLISFNEPIKRALVIKHQSNSSCDILVVFTDS